MVYSWEYLKKYIKNNKISIPFERTPEMSNKYEEYIKTHQNYKEIILKKKLPYFSKNKFQYDIEKNIKQIVYWYDGNLTNSELDKIISNKYPNDNILWFKNKKKHRSIPEINHIHIFIFV
jgi:hypothetical protein